MRSYIYRLVCRQLEHTQISDVPAEASDQIYAAKFKDEIPQAIDLALNFKISRRRKILKFHAE
ncbi:hypothetical protein [uncultured Campylobacter sp.]|uniref:hypothetical protein n=1 Tax=uncultured Campylobacter sp. TaxID=218934 RepID=UPI00261717EB|nr:hypothetical protein [uncultured Campylobacter sp.]